MSHCGPTMSYAFHGHAREPRKDERAVLQLSRCWYQITSRATVVVELLPEGKAWSQRGIRSYVLRLSRCVPGGLLAHADGAVDDATLEDDDRFRVDVALYTRRPLNLHSLVGDDCADDRPPMTASCARMSPCTVPCRPSRSWRAPRTAPSTEPSIFTTPVLSMSPTIFMPDAITDSPASGGGESLRIGTFSVVGFVKIDIADTCGGYGRSASGAWDKLTNTAAGGIRGWWCCGEASRPGRRVHVRRRRSARWCRQLGPPGGRSRRGEHLTHLFVPAVHARQGDLQRVDATVVAFELGNAVGQERNSYALHGEHEPRSDKERQRNKAQARTNHAE